MSCDGARWLKRKLWYVRIFAKLRLWNIHAHFKAINCSFPLFVILSFLDFFIRKRPLEIGLVEKVEDFFFHDLKKHCGFVKDFNAKFRWHTKRTPITFYWVAQLILFTFSLKFLEAEPKFRSTYLCDSQIEWSNFENMSSKSDRRLRHRYTFIGTWLVSFLGAQFCA